MIAAILGALLVQSDVEESLKRAAERMDQAVRSMHQASSPDLKESRGREARLKAVDRSMAEQAEALKLIDELLKRMDEKSDCPT